jgi:hypothetical protein
MQSLLKLAVATTGIMLSGAAPTLSQEKVGEAVLIKTTVTGDSGPLAVKAPVYRDERIRTSDTGLGEFLFRDGTKFAVGWNSSVVIDEFVFNDTKTVKKLSINAAKGTFRWISGRSKSSAYEITTPAGTLGIRGTGLDIFVGQGGLTAVVLLSGAATFCGSNGCQNLTRRCDVVVATPAGGVAPADRVDRNIFNVLGSPRALPFLSGSQGLSRQFRTVRNGCGLSALNAPGRKERGGADRPDNDRPSRDYGEGNDID